jgi:branched-chain amino acid aminotransferase
MIDRVWVNGVTSARSEARVDPFDHGFTVGDGLFETLAVVDGRPTFWDRHLRRLRASAATLGIEIPFDDAALARGAAELLAAAGAAGRLRITATSGSGPLGPARPPGPATVVMATAGPVDRRGPIAVVTVPWVRNERSPLAGVKSTSYGDSVMVLRHARARGADEVLLADTRGRLSEAATGNVFVEVGDRLVTPSRASGCLPGVVRQVLLDAGVAVTDDVSMEVLTTTREVFLTSSLGGVTPVASLDGRPLPAPSGPLTRTAVAALDDAVREDRATPWP